jgi:hypothetical protein
MVGEVRGHLCVHFELTGKERSLLGGEEGGSFTETSWCVCVRSQ